MHCSSLVRTLADVECDCNGHRVLLNLEFFLMFSMVYFGVYCCQEELQWGCKVSKADVGHLLPAFCLSHAPPGVRHGLFLKVTFLWSGYTEQHQQLFYLVKVILPDENYGWGKKWWIVFPSVCVTILPKAIWPHFTARQRELPSRSWIHLIVQILFVLSQAQMLPFCLLRQEDLPIPHMRVLTWAQRKHYLILTCIIFNSCTALAKQESDQNVAHCF